MKDWLSGREILVEVLWQVGLVMSKRINQSERDGRNISRDIVDMDEIFQGI